MKLAYSSLACPGWSVEQEVEAIGRYGFDGIEWRLVDGQLLGMETPDAIIKRLIAVSRAEGVRAVALDSSCRMTQFGEAAQAATLSEARFMVDLAAELGAPFIRVFGGELAAGVSVDEALPAAAETLRAAASYAAEHGVGVLVETHDAVWSHSAAAAALARMADTPAAGVVYDMLHPRRMGESVAETLEHLGEQIRLVHVKDGRRPADGSVDWPLCMIGEGDMPLGEILAGLRARQYAGWYTFEWEKKWHPELAEPEVALPQAAAALRALEAPQG